MFEVKHDLYNSDCITGMQEILEPESVDLIITSIPFEELFTYSGKPEDVGNNGSTVDIEAGRFALNMRFFVDAAFRVMRPGTNVCIHIQQLLAYKNQHGYMGRRDFRGAMYNVFRAGGLIPQGEFVIPKNPQVMAQRLSLHSLQFKTGKHRSGCLLAPAVNDYVLIFHKEGEHPCPPKPLRDKDNPDGWINTDEWVRDASGIWTTIKELDVLDGARGHKENKHEKHVCLARGSLVLTRDGHKPIEEVAVGDMVLTHRGRWRPVLAKACNGVRKVVKVKAQGVPNLQCTPDHRLYTRKASGPRSRFIAQATEPTWVEASATVGSYVNLLLPPAAEFGSFNLSGQEWWLVGRWIADGHRGTRGDWHVSIGPEKIAEFLRKAGEHAGTNRELDATQFRLKALSPAMIAMLERCGSGASGKRLPPEFLELSRENARQLMEGYLSGDGHYLESRNRWMASSVSRELLLDLAMLVQRVHGVIACVYAGKKAGTTVICGRTVNTKQDWILSFDVPGKRRSSPFVLADGAWKKVRSVDDAGEAEVWDLQVEEDQSFVAEGCVVHNCPLQLGVIQRIVNLYTNPISIQPDVTVLDPFMGIGSTAYCCVGGKSPLTGYAIAEPRNVVGFELKESYYAASLDYVKKALKAQKKAQKALTLC
jgi:hypothetical protein